MTGGWERVRSPGGLEVVRCRALDSVPGVVHGFATRRGPSGDADFGPPHGCNAEQRSLRGEFCRAVGVEGAGFAEVRQVHGARVCHAEEVVAGTEADAVVVPPERSAVLAAVRTADCVPVLLGGPRGVAAVHAGWRGVVAEVCVRAVERLVSLGVPPGTLVAAIGPAIGPCCYRVGDDCAAAIEGAVPAFGGSPIVRRDGGCFADLPEACFRQLLGAGLDPGRLHRSPWCTACRPDLFHSFRRDRDLAGRALAAIGYRPAGGGGRA